MKRIPYAITLGHVQRNYGGGCSYVPSSIFIIATCLSSVGMIAVQGVSAQGQVQVLKQPGTFKSPSGSCAVALERSGTGGFLVLTAGKKDKVSVNDVTGMLWVSDQALVFTTSPLYGKPGVFLFSCESTRVKGIIAPHTFTKGYPDGADFFELEGISNGSKPVVYFYYAPDVDKQDFNNFRTPSNLFQANLDGSGFKRSQ